MSGKTRVTPKESAIFEYDPRIYPFREAIERAIDETNLEGLRLDSAQVFTQKQDQSTPWHKLFYENTSEFLDVYHAFIDGVVKHQYNADQLVCQTIPTFRIALPGNVAVGEWHRDTDYGHSIKETNFWVPVTKAYQSNTLFIEGRNVNLDYGEYLIFDGSRLHGNIPNCEGQARVSFDFRIMRTEDYVPSERRTVSAGRRLVLGDYFTLL